MSDRSVGGRHDWAYLNGERISALELPDRVYPGDGTSRLDGYLRYTQDGGGRISCSSAHISSLRVTYAAGYDEAHPYGGFLGPLVWVEFVQGFTLWARTDGISRATVTAFSNRREDLGAVPTWQALNRMDLTTSYRERLTADVTRRMDEVHRHESVPSIGTPVPQEWIDAARFSYDPAMRDLIVRSYLDAQPPLAADTAAIIRQLEREGSPPLASQTHAGGGAFQAPVEQRETWEGLGEVRITYSVAAHAFAVTVRDPRRGTVASESISDLDTTARGVGMRRHFSNLVEESRRRRTTQAPPARRRLTSEEWEREMNQAAVESAQEWALREGEDPYGPNPFEPPTEHITVVIEGPAVTQKAQQKPPPRRRLILNADV